MRRPLYCNRMRMVVRLPKRPKKVPVRNNELFIESLCAVPFLESTPDSKLAEVAVMLVRVDHVASIIVNANHANM